MIDGEVWATASDWARQELPGLPTDFSAMIRRAKRERWNSRPRAGSGGGREYPLSALPKEARETYKKRREKEQAVQIFAEAGADTARQIATAAATSLTARQRAVMEARAAILLEVDRRMMVEGLGVIAAVRALIDDSRTGRLPGDLKDIVAIANDRSGGKPVLCERSIRGWRAAKIERGITALAPGITKTPADLPKWFRDFTQHYARPSKPTIARALVNWREAAPAGTVLPTYKQVRRVLDKLSGIDRMRGREGAQALKARQAYTARDASDLLPTSVYLADGKTFDAEVLHPIHGQPFRPEITTTIDAHTRKIVGFSAALDENAYAVLDALRMACCDVGIPAILYTDRGPGYVNKAMDAALTGFLGRLGITAMRAWPYNSQAKGIVERVNHEWSHLARDFASYISRDMDREAKKAVHQQSRRELKQIGTTRLLPRWDEFVSACLSTILRYNARPHSSLPRTSDPETGKWRHMSPDEAWHAACARGFEPLTVTEEEAEDLFRPWTIRRTRRGLVEWMTNEYFALELEPYDGQEVIVAYDIRDGSRVWVRAIDIVDDARQPGRLIAVAEFGGNKTRYVAHTAERDAMEKRAKARLARLQKHMDVVELELRPTALLEGTARTPMPIIPTPVEPEPVAVPAIAPAPSAARAAGGRPVFRDDISHARWVAGHAEQATASDIAVIRDLISSPSMRDALRLAGIDLDTLRALARAAA